MQIVTFRRLQWSKDGKTLYFGIQEWDRKAAKEGADKAGDKTGDKAGDKAPKPKPAGVDVWHSKNERIIPMQRVDKSRDVERNYLSLWNVDSGKWLRIGTDKDERVSVVEGDRFATETDRKPYLFDNMFDRTRQDVYLVDLTTGARRKAIEGVWYFQGNSPAGNYLLYFKGDQYWTYDIRSGKATNITATIKAVWIDPDYDTPVRVQKPPSGVGGWLKDDAAVLLYDQHDIWRVAPDGSGGVRLTRGARSTPASMAAGRRSSGIRVCRPHRRRLAPCRPSNVSCGSTRTSGGWRKQRRPTRSRTSSRTSTTRPTFLWEGRRSPTRRK
jgi:hypothetical protein